MREILILLKKDLMRIISPLINIKQTIKDRKKRSSSLIILFGIPGLGWFGFVMWKIVSVMFSAFEYSNRSELIFPMLLFGLLIFIVMTSLPYVLAQLYYNKEAEGLMHLPIKPLNILKSKIIGLSLSQIYVILALILPAMLMYAKSQGFALGFTIPYVMLNIINLLCISTLLVAIIISIWTIIMLALTKIPKAKNIMQMFSMLFFFFVMLLFQQLINLNMMENGGSDLQNFVVNSKFIINSILNKMPILKIFVKPLYNQNIAESLMYLAISIISTLVITEILCRLAYKTWIKGYMNSQSEVVKKIDIKDIDKFVTYKKSSVVMSLVKKELLNIFKTPIYIFNIASMGILLPFSLIIPILIKDNFKEFIFSDKLSSILETAPFSNVQFSMIFIVLGMIVGAFFGLGGGTSSSTFTREGKQIWIMQSLPIAFNKQVNARLLTSLIVSLMNLLPVTIIFYIIIKPAIYMPICIILGGLISSLTISSYCLFVDILRPKLEWANPQAAIKQNLNIFIVMAIDFAYVIALGFGGKLIIENYGGSFQELKFLAPLTYMVTGVSLLLSIIFYFANIKLLKHKISKY